MFTLREQRSLLHAEGLKKELEVISFGLQRHVTSYIRVGHYMSMFCWVDQLNYKYKKPLNFIMCILKKGNSNSASNS
jgi:hypothetical protein